MELEECRREIDVLDRDLTKILERRMQVVAEVAAYKKEHHMEIYDPRRERQVLKELSPYLRRIYQCIMDESKKYEREHMGL